jgi:hypothetical protein
MHASFVAGSGHTRAAVRGLHDCRALCIFESNWEPSLKPVTFKLKKLIFVFFGPPFLETWRAPLLGKE